MYSTRKFIIYYFLVSNSVIQHTKKEISPLARSTHDNQSFSQSSVSLLSIVTHAFCTQSSCFSFSPLLFVHNRSLKYRRSTQISFNNTTKISCK